MSASPRPLGGGEVAGFGAAMGHQVTWVGGWVDLGQQRTGVDGGLVCWVTVTVAIDRHSGLPLVVGGWFCNIFNRCVVSMCCLR